MQTAGARRRHRRRSVPLQATFQPQDVRTTPLFQYTGTCLKHAFLIDFSELFQGTGQVQATVDNGSELGLDQGISLAQLQADTGAPPPQIGDSASSVPSSTPKTPQLDTEQPPQEQAAPSGYVSSGYRSQGTSSRTLGHNAKKLLVSWADKSSCSSWLHHYSAERLSNWSHVFNIFTLLLGLVGGSASLLNTEVGEKRITVLVGIVNLASAAMVTIKRNFQITELATAHQISAKHYMAFYRTVAAELIKRNNEVDAPLLQWAELRFNQLNADAPSVPEWAASRFFDMFHGQLQNMPDIPQGLGSLSLISKEDGEETSLFYAKPPK